MEQNFSFDKKPEPDVRYPSEVAKREELCREVMSHMPNGEALLQELPWLPHFLGEAYFWINQRTEISLREIGILDPEALPEVSKNLLEQMYKDERKSYMSCRYVNSKGELIGNLTREIRDGELIWGKNFYAKGPIDFIIITAMPPYDSMERAQGPNVCIIYRIIYPPDVQKPFEVDNSSSTEVLP